MNHLVCMYECVFPPTFNWRLDVAVLSLNLIHHFVLLFLLFPLSVFDLLLLPLLSLFCLVLVGVLYGSREEGFKSWRYRTHYYEHSDLLTHTFLSHTHTFFFQRLNWTLAKCFTLTVTLNFSFIFFVLLLQNVGFLLLCCGSFISPPNLYPYRSCFLSKVITFDSLGCTSRSATSIITRKLHLIMI